MKTKFNLILTAGIFVIGINSHAQNVVLAKNAFFTSPVFDSYQLSMSLDAEKKAALKNMCIEFHKILESYKDMPHEATQKIFKSRRDTPGEWQDFLDSSFKIEFLIDSATSKDLLKGIDKSALVSRVKELKSKEALPFSTQLPMSLEAGSLENSTVVLKAELGSLSAISKTFGMNYSGVRVERKGSQYLLSVYGSDLACDLIEGSGSLVLNSKAIVRPEVSAQDQMGQFYFDLGQKFNSQTNSTKSLRKKIASLGFHTGRILEAAGITDQEKQSLHIENLMDLLFADDSLTPNSLWSMDSRREYFVNVQKMIEVPVKLEINLK